MNSSAGGSHNNNRDLSHLPLRPSTLQLLQKRGFGTVQEVVDARGSSWSDLAAELELDLSQAIRLWHEVQQACGQEQQQQDDGDKENPTAVAHSSRQQQNNSNHLLAASTATRPQTATALLLQQQHAQQTQRTHIITFCRHVDNMLQGGLPLGQLTELAGLPGTGKTQWALQVAVDAALPIEYGGVAGQTLYVDTEGSFSPERCLAMAQALVSHVKGGRQRKQRQPPAPPPLPESFTPEGILQGIHVVRVHEEATLVATLQALPTLLSQQDPQQPPIRLIVVDSLAFPYRAATTTTTTESSDNNNQYYVQRTRQLTSLAALLSNVAREYNLAVLAVNQMTTKVGGGGNFDHSKDSQTTVSVVPALGESWAHAVTTRLLLTCSSTMMRTNPTSNDNHGTSTATGMGDGSSQQRRFCQLTKSPCLPPSQAEYCVTEQGIRDPMLQNNHKRAKSSSSSHLQN